MFPYHEVGDAEDDEIEGEHRCRSYKCKKVTVVATANAIIEPHAVMVLGFDTAVANLAVVAARGAPYSTGATVFDGYFKMDIVGSWRTNQSPTIRRWHGERVIGIISF